MENESELDHENRRYAFAHDVPLSDLNGLAMTDDLNETMDETVQHYHDVTEI